MNIAPKAPLARQGQRLASHGRYGDSELVHMNPYEVQGLAAMSPTGQLTINPETGQPEAFLPFLAPLLGSVLGSAALGGTALGAAGAGALGSGLATWAATGDFEKGLIGGITGFGLGKVFGAAGEAGKAASQADVIAEAGANLGTHATPDLGSAILGGNPVDQAGSLSTIPFSPQQTAYLDVAKGLQNAPPATFGQNLGNMGRGFTSAEGLQAIGNAAMSPSAILPMAVGQGTMAQVEAQEGMDKLRKEATARDSEYAQSFKDVLTDSLGMPRGSNPNPYMGRYAKGGIVGMQNGGDLDDTEGMTDEEYRNYMAKLDVGKMAGLGTGAGRVFGLDADNRYKMNRANLVEDSGSQRQSFLKGDLKQKAPSDYRHGFEKEFQFFDFVEDRPVERYANLFGAGASDYLAGLLAGNTGDAPTTDTYKLADVDEETLKTSEFSGVGPGADQGGDAAMPALVPAGGTGGVSGQATVAGGTAPAAGTVAPPPRGVSAGMKAIQNLGIELDQDYDRAEGESVYDVMQQYGIGNEEIADYFGVDQQGVADAADIIKTRYETGDALGGMDADDDYTAEEISDVYDRLQSGDLSLAAAADYFQTSGPQIQANMAAITERREAASALADIDSTKTSADFTQAEIDKVYNLIDDGTLSVSQVADYFGMSYEDVRAAQDAIAAQRLTNPYTASPVDDPADDPVDTFVDDLADDPADDPVVGSITGEDAEEKSSLRASGGQVGTKRFMTPLGMVEMANGGISELPVNLPMTEAVPEEMVMMESETVIEEPMPDTDFPELVDMTIEAIKGNVEDPDIIINQFIEEYGVEEFRNLREMVLQSIVPDAQTEGMIAGEGGGMDDEVMGMIGEDQQVAVSPGEYIVAADVVSGLGDGNTDAGAVVLDEMMQGVRNARSGGQQPKPLNKAAVMPA